MLVLRCTQKLLVRLKHGGDMPPVESTTRLGDWYGNIVRIGRRQHLLFISERSRLPIVLPITELRRLSESASCRLRLLIESRAALARGAAGDFDRATISF